MAGGAGEHVTGVRRGDDSTANAVAATAAAAGTAMGDQDGGDGGPGHDGGDDALARQRRAAAAARPAPTMTFVSLTPAGVAAPPGGGGSAAAADGRARRFTGGVRIHDDDADGGASRDAWGLAAAPAGDDGQPAVSAGGPDGGGGHLADGGGAHVDGRGRGSGEPPSRGGVADTQQPARDDGDVVMADAADGGRFVAGGGGPATVTTSMPRLPPAVARGREGIAGGGSPSPPPRSPLPLTFSHTDLAAYTRRLSTTVERCGLTGDSTGRAKAAEDELAAGTPTRLAELVDAAEAAGDVACLCLLAAAFGGLVRLAYPRLLDVLLTEPVWSRLIM